MNHFLEILVHGRIWICYRKCMPRILRNILIMICVVRVGDAQVREWTDEKTQRVLEGEFMRVEGDQVLIRKKTGKVVRVTIGRLVKGDQDFVASQKLKLKEVQPPIMIGMTPLKPQDGRQGRSFEIKNTSGKTVEFMKCHVFLFDGENQWMNGFSLLNNGRFKNEKEGEKMEKGSLGREKTFRVYLPKERLKQGAEKVSGIVTELKWRDGSCWPSWEGAAPRRKGAVPVTLIESGVVKAGSVRLLLIGAYNHSGESVEEVAYRVNYYGEDNKKLGHIDLKKVIEGESEKGEKASRKVLIKPRRGIAFVAGGGAFPKGAVRAEVVLRSVNFVNGEKWKN